MLPLPAWQEGLSVGQCQPVGRNMGSCPELLSEMTPDP